MRVKDAGEAFYTAAQMEKRAVRLYERALEVFSASPCKARIARILTDEREHLKTFEAFGAACGPERAQLLSAQASDVLFTGGLVEAQRKGAFETPLALLRYAADEEQKAVERYGEFAKALEGNAAAAFDRIAAEEARHLCALNREIADSVGKE